MPVALLATVALSCGGTEAEPVVVDTPARVASPTAEPATPTAEAATATPEPTPDPFASDRISCTEEVTANREAYFDALEEVKERYSDRFSQEIPDVTVEVARHPDWTHEWEGRSLVERYGIRLHVRDSDSLDLIPDSIEGCPVFGWSPDWGGDRVSCTEEVMGDRQRHSDVLKEVRRRYRDVLYSITGVLGSGIGDVDEDGIRVHFDIEVDAEPPTFRRLIPMLIEGCKVSVKVRPKAREV